MDHRLKKEIGKIEKLKKRKTFKCNFPNCSSQSIGSHSQQRGGQLKVISTNDEVYTMNFNMYEVLTKGQSAFSLKKRALKMLLFTLGFAKLMMDKFFPPLRRNLYFKTTIFKHQHYF